jgi:ATP-dependent helicase HrpA
LASIEPRWLEELGAHLIRRSRSDPHWEKDRGEVVALERGTLYGLPVYANRQVPFAPLDPDLARDIFIRSALVEGDFDTRAPFLAHNRRLVAEIERLEHKSRRPDILVDEALIHAFYDARVPQGVVDGTQCARGRRERSRTSIYTSGSVRSGSIGTMFTPVPCSRSYSREIWLRALTARLSSLPRAH